MGTTLRFRNLGIIILSVYLLAACSKETSNQYSDSEIIARVGDRIITKSEFIMRAEYTPRPVYCRNDNYVHKKIVLNSLIAEKLLALDLENNPEYELPERFVEYLRGRKEQAMRQLHRFEHGIKLASPSTAMLHRGLRNARREYEVAFFNIPDSSKLLEIESLFTGDSAFSSISARIPGLSEPGQRIVSWFDDDESSIREALYSQSLTRDTILQAIPLEDGSFMILQVLGWEDKYSLSETANQTLWNDVVTKIESRMGNKLYETYISNLMRGKSFKFEKETFGLFVNDLATAYMLKDAEKESILNEVIWDMEKKTFSYGELEKDVPYLDQVLFNYEAKSWTVNDLYALIARHPLVFRDVRFPMSQFAQQVRMAVADLLRDESITKDAYSLDYEDRIEIRTHEQLWKDHYLADVYKRVVYGSSSANELQNLASIEFIEDHMNPLIDSLQIKYSNQIFINFNLFDSVDITGIDMFATQEGAAYPIMVPSFPQIYTDHVFDYGAKIEH